MEKKMRLSIWLAVVTLGFGLSALARVSSAWRKYVVCCALLISVAAGPAFARDDPNTEGVQVANITLIYQKTINEKGIVRKNIRVAACWTVACTQCKNRCNAALREEISVCRKNHFTRNSKNIKVPNVIYCEKLRHQDHDDA